MKSKKILYALIALLLAIPAHAEDEAFEGFGYGGISYDTFDLKQGNTSSEPEGFTLRLGYQFMENLAAEAHLGFGAKEDEVNGTAIDVKDYYGFYLRGVLPVGEKFNLFALAGYNSIEVEGLTSTVGGTESTESESDYGYGLGADYEFAENFFLSVDYKKMLDGSNLEAETLNLGFRFNFS